jgi:hypothetical protein
MILRLLGVQGIAGLVVSLCLGVLLILQKGETRHWRKQSGQFEQLYHGEQAAFTGTVANYHAAATAARLADRAAANRVAAEQRAISERTNDAFQSRLADARARAQRLRVEAPAAAADSRSRGSAPMPGLPATAARPDQIAGEDGFSPRDRLIATEQAIQLDELIKWVRRQAAVDPNANAAAAH